MDLPSGFDPATGTFRGVSTPRVQSNHNRTSSNYGSQFNAGTFSGTSSSGASSSYRYTWWDRVNDAIANVGNWIDDIIQPVSGWLSMICMIIGAIGLLIWIFSDGDILGIVLRFLGACIMAFVAMIGLGIAIWCLSMVLKIIRFIFWNAWTLLIALVAGAGIWIYSANSSAFNFSFFGSDDAMESVAQVAENYRCTAKVLNVRAQPTKNSPVLGTIRKGQEVEVEEIVGDFARISFKGQTGYVSLQYLEKEVTEPATH